MALYLNSIAFTSNRNVNREEVLKLAHLVRSMILKVPCQIQSESDSTFEDALIEVAESSHCFAVGCLNDRLFYVLLPDVSQLFSRTSSALISKFALESDCLRLFVSAAYSTTGCGMFIHFERDLFTRGWYGNGESDGIRLAEEPSEYSTDFDYVLETLKRFGFPVLGTYDNGICMLCGS